MPIPLDKAGDRIVQRALEIVRESAVSRPLWPDEFCDPGPEAAWKFVRTCYTWNEAEKEEQPFPEKDYLEEYVHDWHDCLATGQTLILEKCRRMVISWCARALELHQMGLGRCDQILCGEDFEAAAKHVWRLKFIYEGLKKRNPKWDLPLSHELKYEGDRRLKMFGLQTGSICNYANGQATGLQGDGVSIITLEEFGIYRYPASMLAQAKIITQAAPGKIGGFVNIITNASTNQEWQRVKSEDTTGVYSGTEADTSSSITTQTQISRMIG